MKHSYLKTIFILLTTTLFFISTPVYAIKIGLLTNVDYTYFAVSKPGQIIDGYNGHLVLNLDQMKKYVVKSEGSTTVISINDRFYNLGTNYFFVKTASDGFVSTKNKWYRGSLMCFNNNKGLTIINNIDLESYLLGVVPSEMPSSWNIEAHKAQAIAARSYALANLGKRASLGYDLKDTPEDQAYGGASSEKMKTSQAVAMTKGQVMTYENKIIPAYYHASSGGYTTSSGWGKELPFVRSVPAYDGFKPKNGHGVGMSQNGANVLAQYGYNAYQILNYFYKNITFNTVSASL